MTHPDVAAVAAARAVFDGDIVDVRRRRGVGFPDAIHFPAAINGASRAIHALAPCADCAAAGGRVEVWRGSQEGQAIEIEHHSVPVTWTRYHGVPLCGACAWARWRAWQIATWQALTW
jgi:hypothetical protein